MSKATNSYMPLCAFSPWPYGRQVLSSCYKYRPSSSPLSSVVCTSKSTVTSPALSLFLARNQVEHYNMAKFAVSFHLNSFSYFCFVLYIHFPYRVHCLLSSLCSPVRIAFLPKTNWSVYFFSLAVLISTLIMFSQNPPAKF